jgi:hypothetical protein
MDTIFAHWNIIGAVTVFAVIALALWFIAKRRKQSHRLQRRFGTEYGRTVNALGSQKKGESDLKAREKRVEQFTLTPLSDVDAAQFSQAWNALQARFIDTPKDVVAQADQLLRELMLKRGYPAGDFERRVNDISVDHPGFVASYRLAQAIVVRSEGGAVDTEELRQAVVHYRELFDDLLVVNEGKQEVLPASPVAVHA